MSRNKIDRNNEIKRTIQSKLQRRQRQVCNSGAKCFYEHSNNPPSYLTQKQTLMQSR